jgi:O-antigen ligase
VGAAKLALATALLVWFLWRSRRNRLFLLGIPVLMVMGESVFFDGMRPFWTPGRFSPQDHIMGWLFVVWVVIMFGQLKRQGRVAVFGPGRLLPEEIPLLAVAVLVAAQAVVASRPSGDIGIGIGAGADLIYLVAGYVLVRGIVCQFTRGQVIEFLGAVVITNTIAAAMYVVHQGLGIKIYSGAEYFTTQFQSAEITRTFHFAPMFTLLALAFVLAKSRWTPGWLLVLAVTVLSVLVSYTRTLLIAVVAAVVIAVIVRELRNPSSGRFVRRATVVVGSVVAISVIFAVALPAQSEYTVSRLAEFTSARGLSDIGNWRIRQHKYDAVNQVVVKNDPVFGMGFPPPGSNPVDSQVYRLSADMTWIPILYHTGYVGLALFGLTLLAFGLRALKLTLGGDEAKRYLGLTYLITICLTALVGFTAWTFMQPQIAPMGLWFLGFVAGEALAPATGAASATVTRAGAATRVAS